MANVKPTLEEALKDLKESEWVYLGCKRGSGYIAINKAGEIKNDLAKIDKKHYDSHIYDLKSAIEKILSAPRTRRNVNRSLEIAEEKAKHAHSEANKIAKELKKSLDDRDDEKLSELIDSLADSYKECDKAVKACIKCEKTIDNLNSDINRASSTKDKILATLSAWVPFEERLVSQQYRKKSDPHFGEDGSVSYGIVLLIEGDERGEYWTYNEVLNGIDAEEGESDDAV